MSTTSISIFSVLFPFVISVNADGDGLGNIIALNKLSLGLNTIDKSGSELLQSSVPGIIFTSIVAIQVLLSVTVIVCIPAFTLPNIFLVVNDFPSILY